jgi:hypothetical protein
MRLVGWRPERELAMTTPPQCAEEQRSCDDEKALADRIWASLSVVYATRCVTQSDLQPLVSAVAAQGDGREHGRRHLGGCPRTEVVRT